MDIPFSPFPPSPDLVGFEGSLYCLAHWTGLRSLVLAGLPVLHSGDFLVAICRGCPQLRQLSLASLGTGGQCKFLDGLRQALEHTPCLEDLRSVTFAPLHCFQTSSGMVAITYIAITQTKRGHCCTKQGGKGYGCFATVTGCAHGKNFNTLQLYMSCNSR